MSRPQPYPSTPQIARFNAWFFDTLDGFIDWLLRPIKLKTFVDLPQTVVEIGPGVGATFRYYEPGTTVVAIEPNSYMHPRLRENAEKAGIDLVIKDSLAEDTGLPTESAQVVVSSLVLCTVTDPVAAVAEVQRILEPGGRFIFMEHIRGSGRVLRSVQRHIARPWKRLFEGCELSRNTDELIGTAGFHSVSMRKKTVITPFIPVNHFVFGEAIK